MFRIARSVTHMAELPLQTRCRPRCRGPARYGQRVLQALVSRGAVTWIIPQISWYPKKTWRILENPWSKWLWVNIKIAGLMGFYGGLMGFNVIYPLVMTNSLLLKMTIEIVDCPIKKWWLSIVMLVYQVYQRVNGGVSGGKIIAVMLNGEWWISQYFPARHVWWTIYHGRSIHKSGSILTPSLKNRDITT